MIRETIICAREDCEIEAVKTTHNQKYCSPICCRIATNARIMANYHEERAIARGKKRTCKKCGVEPLSRYNKNNYCASCETKMRQSNSSEIADMLSSVTWL